MTGKQVIPKLKQFPNIFHIHLPFLDHELHVHNYMSNFFPDITPKRDMFGNCFSLETACMPVHRFTRNEKGK